MLDPFELRDYSLGAIRELLVSDPALPIGFVASLALWFAGARSGLVRDLALAFTLAFAPLAIWIWDIPLTQRVICMHLHDHRAFLRSRHLYALGAVLFPVLVLWLRRRKPVRRGPASP